MEEREVAHNGDHGTCPLRRHRAAVETTPSMPFAPRLASTLGGFSVEGANHSRSRTGIEDDTTSVADGETAPSRQRARPGSVASRCAAHQVSMAACASDSATAHRLSQALFALYRCKFLGLQDLLAPGRRFSSHHPRCVTIGIAPAPTAVHDHLAGSRTGPFV